MLLVFVTLAIDKDGFSLETWWEQNYVNFDFTKSVFDLVLSTMIRSIIIIILGFDCFAPCSSRVGCCVTPLYPEQQQKQQQQQQKDLEAGSPLQNVASPTHRRVKFAPLMQIYTPWPSKFARIFGFFFAVVILFGNLPFLLAKVLFYNREPFNIFYILLIIAAFFACILEAPLLLKLWFMKRKIHHLRRQIRHAQHRRPKNPEAAPLLNHDGTIREADEDGFYSADEDNNQSSNVTRLRKDSRGRAVSAVYYDFYEYEHSSDSEEDDLMEDGQEGDFDPFEERGPPREGIDDENDPEGAFLDPEFRTPRGSFYSAREQFSDDEEEEGNPEFSTSLEKFSSVPLSRPRTDTRSDPPGDGNRLVQFLNLLKSAIGVNDVDTMRLQMPAWAHEGDSVLERNVVLECPQFFRAIAEATTPLDRMVAVAAFFISTLLSQENPRKKPFNPVLGEQFHCSWPDTEVSYFSEQVSHHPPVSTFQYIDKKAKVEYSGSMRPITTFTGSSFMVTFQGQHRLVVRSPVNQKPPKRATKRGGPAPKKNSFDDEGEPEEYRFQLPVYYLRGLLVGNMYADFGGQVTISCEQTGCRAVLNFLEKPLVGGEPRRISGSIFDEMSNLRYTLTGRWDTMVELTNAVTRSSEVLFDAKVDERTKPQPRPVQEQGEMESQRVWYACARLIHEENWALADKAKAAVEEFQRRYQRDIDRGTVQPYKPVYFDVVDAEALEYQFVGEEAAKKRQGWLSLYTSNKKK